MRKRLVSFMMIFGAVLCLYGCGGKKAICDFCSEEKVCETKTVFGEEVNVCKDCMKELQGK